MSLFSEISNCASLIPMEMPTGAPLGIEVSKRNLRKTKLSSVAAKKENVTIAIQKKPKSAKNVAAKKYKLGCVVAMGCASDLQSISLDAACNNNSGVEEKIQRFTKSKRQKHEKDSMFGSTRSRAEDKTPMEVSSAKIMKAKNVDILQDSFASEHQVLEQEMTKTVNYVNKTLIRNKSEDKLNPPEVKVCEEVNKRQFGKAKTKKTSSQTGTHGAQKKKVSTPTPVNCPRNSIESTSDVSQLSENVDACVQANASVANCIATPTKVVKTNLKKSKAKERRGSCARSSVTMSKAVAAVCAQSCSTAPNSALKVKNLGCCESSDVRMSKAVAAASVQTCSTTTNSRTKKLAAKVHKETEEEEAAADKVMLRQLIKKKGFLSKSAKRGGVLPTSPTMEELTALEFPLSLFMSQEEMFIDSHFHPDFIYSKLVKKEDDEGLEDWSKKYSNAFPTNFSGCIANFIQPSLFTPGNDDYCVDWIEKEMKCNLYKGATYGVHPHFAEEYDEASFAFIESAIVDPKWRAVGVGECGIDLFKSTSSLSAQKTCFRRQVALAITHEMTLVVHCRPRVNDRRAEDECIAIITEEMGKVEGCRLNIHRHCFTGSWEIAQDWLAIPNVLVVFGFTPSIFSFDEDSLEAVSKIPLNRIILETDAPYFKPIAFKGTTPSKVAMPGMAISSAFVIAKAKNVEVKEVLESCLQTTISAYNLKQ